MKVNFRLALLCSGILLSGSASAIPLIAGLGGDADFGELAMTANDDGSSNSISLPFEINFYGNNYNSFFINNNGNISFNSGLSSFTPSPFPISNQPMIAPYWADVDTRGTGAVYVGAANEDTVVVTWNNVGYYSQQTNLTNNFQLVMRNQNNGDFDIEFRYDELNWTTGDASGGSNGLGGTPAQAGFDAGDGSNYFVLPGSFSDSVLALADTTNVAGAEDGLWSFAIRNGTTPGETPDNPLLPIAVEDSFVFEFGVELEQTVFIDPLVAIGYDYEITSGPNFASVLLPTGFGDDLFDLYQWNGSDYEFLSQLAGGVEYNFGQSVDRFRILGIEPGLGLDPSDPTAFVTGLTFDSNGVVQMTQTPITFETDPSSQVPVPSSLALILIGLGIASIRRR